MPQGDRIPLTNEGIMGEMFHRMQNVPLGWVAPLAMQMGSDQGSEKHGWLGDVPSMKARLGELQGRRARAFTYEIENLKYETTLNVTGDEYRRDKTGQVAVRIGEVAQSSARHWASLVSNLMINGAAAVCYDGEYFFDTDHSEGDSGTQSNKIDVDISTLPVANHGTITLPSVAEAQQVMLNGIIKILGFKTDSGELFNENAQQFRIEVPTTLYAPFASAITLPMMDSGNSNILQGGGAALNFKMDVRMNARLTGTDKIFVYRTDADVKPFILQEEFLESIEIGFDSEHFRKKDEALFALYTSRGAGYGFWQTACQVTMT